MTCRDEILEVAVELARASSTGEFTLEDVVEHMNRRGTRYAEQTIRTHVTSRLCANAPDHHAVTYDDFIRTDKGTYRQRVQETLSGKT